MLVMETYTNPERTWADARADCRARGGELAATTTRERRRVMYGAFVGGPHWVDGTDADQRGTWRFHDGTIVYAECTTTLSYDEAVNGGAQTCEGNAWSMVDSEEAARGRTAEVGRAHLIAGSSDPRFQGGVPF